MNVLPVVELREMQLLMFVHKYLYQKQLLPEIFHNYFTKNNFVHNHVTRRNADLFVQRAHNNSGQRSSLFKGSAFWNLLPADLKTNSSILIFKRNVKAFIISRFM